MDYETLKKAQIISFDIFDTLLVRNVCEPNKIFDLIEEIYALDGFCERRIAAAEKARRNSKNGEATIWDIYANLQEDPQIEFGMESRYLQANSEIKKIYDWGKENKKTIIAVSDMYMPAEFLGNILEKNGIFVDRLFVSCEEKCNKASGELFDVVAKKCGVQAKDIVHIGDSWKSDFISPIKHGWRAIHYKKTKQKQSIVSCIVNNNKTDNYFFNMGYSIMGPLVAGFVKWLKEELNNNQIENVIFLARDGKILKEAYEEIYGKKADYAYISRQAINTCVLWMQPDFENIKTHVIRTEHTTIGKFIKRLGLEARDFENEIKKNGLTINDSFSDVDLWKDSRVRALYEAIKRKVVDNSKEQYQFFISYIAQFIHSSKVALVDLGWKGTIQDRLTELLFSAEQYKNIQICGYYYGIEQDKESVNGYLYKDNHGKERKIAIDAGFGLIETMFLAREGTTLSYSEKGVVLDSYEVSNPNEYENLLNIHRGAMEFVRKAKECNLFEVNSEWEKFNAYAPFEELSLFPNMKDLKSLGTVGFKDTEDTCLIKKNKFSAYVFNPKKILTDYHAAPWKIGFLKINICGLIPWGWIYKKIKRGSNL